MTGIEAEILSRKIIHPSSPTPPHLKTLKLSLLDQLSTEIHGNMTFFYPSTGATSSFSDISHLLQDSLSKTLTHYYPLAGRYIDASTVDCNDEGVYFVEARVDSPISHFLTKPNPESLDLFIPTTNKETVQLSKGFMLIIQITGFSCGGIAVGLSLSHKIADIAALLSFLKTWTAVACNSSDVPIPQFVGESVLPPRELPPMSTSINIAAAKFTARRFVFAPEKIAELRARVGAGFSSDMKQPSRVEVVLALLWKCAMEAASQAKADDSFQPSALFQAINLRSRMDPPLPETAIGNFIWPFLVLVEDESDLNGIVFKMRESINDFLTNKVNSFKGENGFAAVLGSLKERGEFLRGKPGLKIYKCSSWCRFPLFDTDFGFGKPVWHYSANKFVSNTIALMDTEGRDGVEALVTLDDDEMEVFERNEELLAYATANPSVL